jgi:hypothetical protein
MTEARAMQFLQRRGVATKEAAESELRKSAAVPITARYDVFLSHCIADAALVLAAKAVLEAYGMTVYVDWLEDPQADRSHVTPDTARMLRTRMQNARMLVFAMSRNSAQSRWMPWELGYFDGLRSGRVAIFPLVGNANESFVGQEYLGLYPYIEERRARDRLYIRTRTGKLDVSDFAAQ